MSVSGEDPQAAAGDVRAYLEGMRGANALQCEIALSSFNSWSSTHAPDRDSLVVRTRCLDRVLSWHQFIVPQFYSGKEMMAYWNRFTRPAKTAKYSRGATDTWWVDETKDRALRRGENK